MFSWFIAWRGQRRKRASPDSDSGGRRGGLVHVHPADLGGFILGQIVETQRDSRSRLRRRRIRDDRCGRPARRQHRAGLLARRRPAAERPRLTVDRQCGSSQQAVHLAVQVVMSGTQDVVIASGVQTMS